MGLGQGGELEPALGGRELEDPLVGPFGDPAVEDGGGNGVEVREGQALIQRGMMSPDSVRS